MHFKAGEKKIKATLEIGSNKYEIRSPLVGEKDNLSMKVSEAKNILEQSKIIKEFICSLGNIPMDELNKLDQETFDQLFEHIVSVKKN